MKVLSHILGISALLLAACSGVDPAEAGPEAIEQVQEAVQNSGDFTDSSGKVTVRIKACAPKTGNHVTATCSVDTDFVLIGGGADIINDGEPGALLTGSFPNRNLTTWTATSKDHGVPYSHQLRAYAVGLKLTGVSSAQLRSFMFFQGPVNSGDDQHVSDVAELPPGFQLVGGGATVHDAALEPGQLLFESYPDGPTWVGSTRDHQFVQRGSVDVYAIGITTGTIPGFGRLTSQVNSAFTHASTGYGAAQVPLPTGWVLASVGGQATSSVGRLLTSMVPFDNVNVKQTSVVKSKDHIVAASGFTGAYLISIKKR